jgi:deoxyribonuclease-4
MWRAPSHRDEDVTAFVDGCQAAELGPVFLHSVYLLNLASPLPENVAKSVQSIRDHLHWADRLCAEGLVIHIGSAGKEEYAVAEDRVIAALAGMLADLPGQAKLLLETCAGQGATIGRSFDELARIIRRLDGHPRLGVCLDTCHVFAAGYAIHEEDGVDRMLDELEASAAAVVSTGNEADAVRAQCRSLRAHRPWLMLDGLRVIYQRNSDRHGSN